MQTLEQMSKTKRSEIDLDYMAENPADDINLMPMPRADFEPNVPRTVLPPTKKAKPGMTISAWEPSFWERVKFDLMPQRPLGGWDRADRPFKTLSDLAQYYLMSYGTGRMLHAPRALGYEPKKKVSFPLTPKEETIGEIAETLGGLRTAGQIFPPLAMKYLPLKEAGRRVIATGGQFLLNNLSEQASRKIGQNEPLKPEEMLFETIFGGLFGLAEAGVAKGLRYKAYKTFAKKWPKEAKAAPRILWEKFDEAVLARQGGMPKKIVRKVYGKYVKQLISLLKRQYGSVEAAQRAVTNTLPMFRPSPENAVIDKYAERIDKIINRGGATAKTDIQAVIQQGRVELGRALKSTLAAKPPEAPSKPSEIIPPAVAKKVTPTPEAEAVPTVAPTGEAIAPAEPTVAKRRKTYPFVQPSGAIVEAEIIGEAKRPQRFEEGIRVKLPDGEFDVEKSQLLSSIEEQFNRRISQWKTRETAATFVDETTSYTTQLARKKAIKERTPEPKPVLQEVAKPEVAEKPTKPTLKELTITAKPPDPKKYEHLGIPNEKGEISVWQQTRLPTSVGAGPWVSKDVRRTLKPVNTVGAFLKRFARTIPEFTVEPVFTVESEKTTHIETIKGKAQEIVEEHKRLIWRHIDQTYRLEPSAFGIDPAQLTEGQKVRVDLESYGIKPASKVSLKKAELLRRKVGAPSRIGFPAQLAGYEMVVSMEPIRKPPVSARDIISHLSKALRVTYANMATHRPRKAAGFYEVRSVEIRQINVRDLDTASHEVGHHIDHFYKIRQAGISKAGRKTWKMPEGTAKGTAAELVKLGKMLYGDKAPKGGYKSEGIAEFIRGYLTGHLDIEKEAPNFYKWFTKDYLPNNPEVADGLLNARDMLTDYRLQGAEARIESQISRKEIAGTLKDRAKRVNLWLQSMFVDEFAPLRKAMEEAGIERGKLKPSEDPYELAVYYSQKEGARARGMVLHGTIDLWGNKTGKGLKEIMKPIADENAVRPFTHFVVAARSLDLLKRGIKPGISKADAQHVYDLYKDNPGWKETAKEITDWNGRVLDYLVQAGGLEKEVADRMRELNPIYVPFLRAFAKGEKRFGGGGAGRGLITTKKGVFGIKGSGREIIDPFESMITQTRRMISIAHKSVIARALANLEAQHRGLAGFIWRVPPPKKATTFKSEQAIRQLEKMGAEVTGADADALMTIYGNSPIYLGKENLIAIVQNGKKTWYEVSPEMHKLLQGLDKFYLPRFLNVILGKPGRAVRLGATGINASFGLVRNPIRDALDTIFKGTHARGPLASVQGVAKDLSRLGLAKSLGINPSKAAQEFVAMGGQISGFVGQDRKSLQHLRGEMLASSVGRYSIHTVSHPVDALRQVFGVAESGPRIQEYEKALIVGEKKYGKGSPSAKIYAFNKAQDQTINYSRHGVIGKWLNQMIPFWNANAQDLSKVYRTFRTRGKEATAYAVAFLTLPALGLWWLNKDEEWYKELPAYETANYMHVKVPGKDIVLRLPVPFLVGHIFQSTPVVMMDALYRADPKRIKEHFEHVLRGDVYPLAEIPALFGPLIDAARNEDWAGRPIVPRSVEGKLPSDQYKEYTTEFCKTIGKIFKYPPAKIEYLINAYSGGLYRRTGRIAGIVTKAPEETQPADWPVIGAIIVRDLYAPKRSIERFYNEKDRLNRMYQSDKIEPESNLDTKRKRYNYISTKYLSLYWKKLQKAKAASERKQIYGKIGALIKKAEKTK